MGTDPFRVVIKLRKRCRWKQAASPRPVSAEPDFHSEKRGISSGFSPFMMFSSHLQTVARLKKAAQLSVSAVYHSRQGIAILFLFR
jgi:hypothetical protein